MEERFSASNTPVASQFPRYDAAVLGFKDYWYPVLFSRDVQGKRVRSLTLLGQQVVFVRERGKVHALHDRCLHRGIPLSLQTRREFPGTISCMFHGWTYDLESGNLVAAITDGPDSPICGKVRVRTYPVEERLGLIWIYMGDGTPPPVEACIPRELLRADVAVEGRTEVRPGNWRHAVEGGIDEAHAKYLHRTSPWMLFRDLPTWTKIHMERREENEWLVRMIDEVGFDTEFPGLGHWPNDTSFTILGRRLKKLWKARGRNAVEVAVRLPGQLRAKQWGWTEYYIVIPVDERHYQVTMLGVRYTRGLDALVWKIRYWTYIRALYHGHLTGQDRLVTAAMRCPPERLFRPDLSITAWRRMCDQEARGSIAGRTVATGPGANGTYDPAPVAVGDHSSNQG